MEPEREYSYSFRFARSGKPTKLLSGFKPCRHQQISDQESPYFLIPGNIQDRERIIGQEPDFFQPEKERVRPYDPEIVVPAERSTKKQQKVSNTSNEASSPKIRNDSSTHIEHNSVTPESTISINTLWLKCSQFLEQTQKESERRHENISRLQDLIPYKPKLLITFKRTQLRKASEVTNKRLNQVLEEKHHFKRGRDCLDQDLNKLINVCKNIKPQTQGNVLDNPYHQEDIKPDALLKNKPRSPSQYQDGYNMIYSEKEALKQLPEASSWPKFSGVGEYDCMELIYYIDGLFLYVPSIPEHWMTARLNTAFKGNYSI
ncbi:hypothetical protein O181_057707 [Austropuccinia psidii MF-1]|uniref:Uncharacterized protein n=1 Tax=Austropuccinia psidii MF-1 TaxID=1389203 RepID=A0A9Q3HVQ2_9BASI|nr:hypothetical protein [Austropuccinia psidii MF-1]